ncbi:MAG: hypothetical protein AAF495_03655 [Pseudomonadota bacterium]
MAEIDWDEIAKAADALKGAATQIAAHAHAKRADRALEEYRQASGQLAVLNGLVQDSDVAPGAIREFFETVGDGVASAQVALDRRSADYERARSFAALPSLYRIPKVSAEIKFSLEQTEGSGFNFIFGRSETTRQEMQNSVSFDIISSPPPPESLEEIPSGGVFISDVAERAAVRSEVARRHEASEGENVKKVLAKFIDNKAWTRTVILAIGNQDWLLFLPTGSDSDAYECIIVPQHSGRTLKTATTVPDAKITNAHRGAKDALKALAAISEGQAISSEIDWALITASATSVKQAAAALQNNAKRKKRKAFENYKSVRQSLARLSQLVPEATMVEGTIEGFFDAVGEGVVQAQRSLDKRSEAYEIERPGFALPNHLRIPKVSASIKFELEQTEARKFNVIVYRKTDSHREAMQNSIAFEIVSAPPAPNSFEAPAAGRVVLQRLEREVVRAEIIRHHRDPSFGAVSGDLERFLSDDALDRTLIVSIGNRGWFLFLEVDKDLRAYSSVMLPRGAQGAAGISFGVRKSFSLGDVTPRRANLAVTALAEITRLQEQRIDSQRPQEHEGQE